MKRNLLTLVIMLSACWGYSQSLQVSTASQTISGDANTLLTTHVEVHNVTGSPVDVVVHRTVNGLSSGHQSYFCWGINCYPPTVSISPLSESIAANDTNHSFIGYVNPYGNSGTTVVRYCFVNNNNNADSACINFTFNATLTGIEELIARGISLTSAFPTPADNSTQIGYNLALPRNAKLVLYNLLGSVVRVINLTEKQDVLTVPTSDLKNGIYLYSLLNDDKVVTSKKLIVSHR